MLDPDALAIARMQRVGDIAGGKDIRIAGAQCGVDEDAVVDVEAGRPGELCSASANATSTASALIW